jgi:opacity protein-like surface antigen
LKKVLLVFVALLILSAGLFAQYGDEKRIEFSITGGFGLSSLDAVSSYVDDWGPYYHLQEVYEYTDFTMTKKNSFTLGASLSYFFTPNVGIQFGGAYFAPKTDIYSDWGFTWNWYGFGDVSDSDTFGLTEGKFSSIPLYINLIAKYRMGSIELFASGGPAFFINKFEADATSLYGDSLYLSYWWGSEQFIDFFAIPVYIDQSWTGFGFDVGGGVDILFSPSMAFTVEARYFYCPNKDLYWTWQTGTYDSFEYGWFAGWDYSDFSTAESLTSALTIKPSFFSISGGFKFFF